MCDQTIKVIPALRAFIARSQSALIPEEVRELARRHILDALASIVACGIWSRRSSRASSRSLSRVMFERTRRLSSARSRQPACWTAVFASAMTGHAAEINDFIPSALVQPDPSIVSAVIALAEQRRKAGEELVRAVITGYELAGRIPKALGHGNLRRAGMPTTALVLCSE